MISSTYFPEASTTNTYNRRALAAQRIDSKPPTVSVLASRLASIKVLFPSSHLGCCKSVSYLVCRLFHLPWLSVQRHILVVGVWLFPSIHRSEIGQLSFAHCFNFKDPIYCIHMGSLLKLSLLCSPFISPIKTGYRTVRETEIHYCVSFSRGTSLCFIYRHTKSHKCCSSPT